MKPVRALLLAGLLSLLVAVGCAADPGPDRVTIEVWAHDGTDAERAVLEQQVTTFNDRHDDLEVKLRLIAEGDYNDALQTAVASGHLPDVAEVDGPLLAGYVHQGALVPLDGLLPDAVLARQLPSLKAQGSHGGRTYAVGTFDSGLGLYADRRALEAAGVEWPTSVDDAWSAEEFGAALAALAKEDADGKVLDVKLNYGVGEWLTYGFAPLVASAGGGLIDQESLSPTGRLDGAASRRALATLQGWAPYVDPNEEDDAFVSRRAPLSWVGHWTYRDYAAALGDDLLVLPLPDLGKGSKTGQGSWAWTVTASGDAQQQAAATFLAHLLEDEEVLRMADANGAVPGNSSALEASSLYAEDGPLALFADQLVRSCGNAEPTADCVAVPRPVTPGYAVLSSQFAQAVSVALSGRTAGPALEEAAVFVQGDLEDNDGFR
ncbi:ABC transporter substrate-binding protein [Nocardioides sp. CPCC 206347]|uniref:ABC transporter substrate-binding protein n=1 Tax=unclassified Nocardioides TaxID=2615069 RepID=UPI0036078BF7